MKRLTWAIAVGVLAGCTSVEPPSPPPLQVEPVPEAAPPPARRPPAARAGDVESLLAEFPRLRRLNAAELMREQEAARQAFSQSRSDAARVRLALTLALPGSVSNEEVRALEILDPVVRNPGSALNGLAMLLAGYIQEQRRLGGQLQGLQQNVQGLQQKLEALRSLERSLSERGEGARKK